MKNKVSKIIITVLVMIGSLLLLNTISKAASFNSSISKTIVTVGDTFSITVKANNAAGMYEVSKSNSNVSVSSGSTTEFLDNGSATITFKAVKAGTVTITAKATDMTDLDDDTKKISGTKTYTVTIKEKSSSNSGGSSSNSGGTSSAPSFTTVNETVYAKSEVNVRKSYSTSSTILGSLKAGDSITRTGKSSEWSRVSYNGQTAYISSSFLTTTKPEETDKSNNKNLKSLTVKPSTITPTFSSDVTEYEMSVGIDVNSIEVNAVAEDSKAKVAISGNKDLKEGTNTISIKVTAEDETVRTYKIIVTKESKEQLKLAELSIEGITLEPDFSSDIYEYNIKLSSAETKELTITAKPNREGASVEIVGNTDLKVGENLITILVKSTEEDVITYQITAIVPTVEEKATIIEGISDQDLYKYIGIAAAAIIILIILIIIIVKHRKNKEDNFETYYGGYNLEKDKTDEAEKIEEMNDKKIEAEEKIVKPEEKKEEDVKPLKKSKKADEDLEIKDASKEEILNKHFGEINSTIDMDNDNEPKKRKGKHSR